MKNRISLAVSIFVLSLLVVGLLGPVSAATEEEIELAIEAGMAWLADQQNPIDGSWGEGWALVARTGLAVLKFETHAIQECIDPLDMGYMYYDQVRNGLDYIFANAWIVDIGMQPAGDPDTDGDGIGVHFGGQRTYESSIAMMAIAASTHPEMTVNVLGSAVDGWTYEDVLQDAVDYFAWGQTDFGSGRGGWYYEEMDNAGDWSDNSNTGYAVLGLAYAEAPTIDGKTGFGCTIPDFVKSEHNIWIDYIQNDPGPADDGPWESDPDGGSGYGSPDQWVNILKTGNLLFEMAFVGDDTSVQRVIDAADYIDRHWYDADYSPGWMGPGPGPNPWDPPGWPDWPACYQAMYTTMKGLEALGIDYISPLNDPSGIDWFDEFANVILAQQNPDGSWPSAPGFGDYQDGSVWWWGDDILSTEWALLTLQKAVIKFVIPVFVDIKPASWPNPLQLKEKGVLPVAICGTEDFDVTTIDPSTVQLTLEGLDVGVSPLRWSLEDVATPYEGEPCSGHDLGADGYLDLTLKFKTQEVIETLGLKAFSDRDVVILILTGNLKEEFDGTSIMGQDCIVILHK